MAALFRVLQLGESLLTPWPCHGRADPALQPPSGIGPWAVTSPSGLGFSLFARRY